MSKSKTTTERRMSVEEQIKQLEIQRKQLVKQEKEEEQKAMTDRLCKRGELLESLLPDVIALTDEQLKAFLESTLLTEFARRKLDGLTVEETEHTT